MGVSSRNLENTPEFCPLCGGVVIVRPASVPAKDAPCPHCGELLWFVRKTVGDAVVLTFLPGLMSGSDSIELVDEVVSAIGGASRVVLDLSHLRFISSMFLGMVVVLHKRIVSAQGAMRICGVQREASVVFRITKLDTVFDIHPDVPVALDSF
jgi:anti-sigma B factor antagonist